MAFILPSQILNQCNGGILYCLMQWANTVTNGFFISGLLIAFCVALLMATINQFGTTRSWGFSSVVGLLGAIFLATSQLMAWWIASLFILVGVVGFVAMILNER